MHTQQRTLLSAGIITAGAAAAAFWWFMLRPEPVPALPDVPATAAIPVPPGTAAAPPAPAASTPIELPVATQPLAAGEVGSALANFFGRKAILTFFQLEDFPRKFVATVDNLGRSHAPPMAWPVNPTAGQFTVDERGGATVINADNSLRYTPLVLLAESIDAGKAVDLYIRMYPVLQQTYVELGYPKGQFNDRLIQVIDQLLATPGAAEAVKVQLTEVKGSVPSLRPWVRYEFSNPALESLSAGQKIMLRVGAVNQHRLKARLVAVRQEILQRAKPQ